jgi:hypothetical protein
MIPILTLLILLLAPWLFAVMQRRVRLGQSGNADGGFISGRYSSPPNQYMRDCRVFQCFFRKKNVFFQSLCFQYRLKNLPDSGITFIFHTIIFLTFTIFELYYHDAGN